MSIAAEDEPKHEIVIVRRAHGDHDEGHHGGVWKIAFADFMTAMMCFFLVMWLINASNEQTQAAVASYFNPVKLIDRNSSKKGLEDLGDGPQAAGTIAAEAMLKNANEGQESNQNIEPSSKVEDKSAVDSKNHSDEHLFANPYAVLSEIAEQTGVLQNVSAKGDGGAQTSGPSTGASGGEAYRDPFAPDFWSQQVASAAETAEGVEQAGEASAERSEGTQSAAAAADMWQEGSVTEKPLDALAKGQPRTEKSEKVDNAASDIQAEKPAEPTPETVKAADAIRNELAEAFKADTKLADGISVIADEKGVKISVTEQFDFGMFEIGSALPRRELVLAMEKIGRTLAEQKGRLTIGGHTDARPFRNADYDNWRLSSARAQSAYYMLVRGGLDEARITEVIGHADRDLKDKADPFGAVNRRIEILLDVDG